MRARGLTSKARSAWRFTYQRGFGEQLNAPPSCSPRSDWESRLRASVPPAGATAWWLPSRVARCRHRAEGSWSRTYGAAGASRTSAERVWLVTFMRDDLGYFEDETCPAGAECV